MFHKFKISLFFIMMAAVLVSIKRQSEFLCVISETSMRAFMELKWAIPEERESLSNEKIRCRHRPIAAGSRGGRSKSVKSHYIKYEKPQYTI
jgi:hypothetical protein